MPQKNHIATLLPGGIGRKPLRQRNRRNPLPETVFVACLLKKIKNIQLFMQPIIAPPHLTYVFS
jgi:hypothetical protein